MRDWKKVGRKILFPPIWVIVLLTVVCTVALLAIFANGWEMSLLAYVSYVLSFYTLTVVCIFALKLLPGCYRTMNSRMHGNKYIDRYLTDAAFKTKIGLYRSLVINLLYVAMNAISGIVYRTYWFGELKRARLCAAILLTVNLALSGAVLMMVYFDRGFQYQGFLIYVIAMYTFYVTVTAIIDLVKYRKYKSPVMSITKVIKMTSALFSMLFLETAMFAQFGAETSAEAKRLMIMLTGAGISVVVVSMAIYMIVQTSKEMKTYKRE